MNITRTSSSEIKARIKTNPGLFNINGNQLHLEVSGAGLPIIFLHDGVADSSGFENQFEYFAKEYTVIRYDREGYGSSKPPLVPYSEVNDLKSIYDLLGIDSAILIGGSAGGRLALNMAIVHPERVAALVLVGAAISGFEFSEHMWYRGWRQRFEDTTSAWTNFWVLDPWFIAEENQQAKVRLREILETSRQNLENFDVEKLAAENALPHLAEIRVPTLIVVGEHDIADNHAQSGIIQFNVSGSERMIVTHSGHLVYLEQPEEFNNLTENFLAKHF